MHLKPKVVAQSPEQVALQQAIDAKAEAARVLSERRAALSRTEQAIVETEQFLKNAESDLEAAIAEASDQIGGDAVELLPDCAVDCAERISRLKQQLAVHVKIRDKLRGDVSAAGMGYKRAGDDLEVAKRPLLQAESAKIAERIDELECEAAELRARLHAMADAAPDGLDGLILRALHMVRGYARPAGNEIVTNSPLWHRQRGWTQAYRDWRQRLEQDPQAPAPQVP